MAARLRVDMQMAVGQLSEKVVVTAASPLLETDSSQRSQVITNAQMLELALNGREYSALALLSTGVRQSALNKSTNGTPREGAFNVNGLRSTFNNFLIDGVDNNAYGTSNQGFSNQVMQPPPDAVGEFRVVTNNQSAEYGRAAGRHRQRRVPQRRESVSRRRVGVLPRHGAEREHFLPAARRAEAAAAPQSVRRRARWPNRGEQGVLLRRLRGVPPGQEGHRVLDAADGRAELGDSERRHPRSAHRRHLSGRHPDSDDRVREERARRLAGAESGRRREQLFDRTGLHQRHRQGRREGRSAGEARPCRCSGRYGWRSLSTNDQPPIPLPSGGGGNGNIYARNKQVVLGATYAATDRSLLEVRFGWSNTQGGKNPPALGSSDNFGISPGCRPIRASPAVCLPRPSAATRRSAGRRPTRSGSTRRCGIRR